MFSSAQTIRLLLALLCAAAVSCGAWAQAGTQDGDTAQRRIALVVGNNAYESAPLANSVNDAQAMAGALREAGFAVTLLTDVDQRQFQLALREFGERLKAASGGGTGLFYYAGHGVQIRGRNFLIPVRSNIFNEDEVAYAAVDAQAVLDKMESAGNGTNIVILDACRNNPFTRSYRSAQQGLAQMDAPVGTLVAYATAPGSVAVDSGRGMRNGLYTTHLLDAVRNRGLKVEDVFKQVRNAVLRASSNKQMPWEASALVGDFYFHPPAPGQAQAGGSTAQPAPDPAIAVDDALWEAVKDARGSAEIFAYLSRFPRGRHAREARRRLLELTEPAQGSAFATTLSTPQGDPEALERLGATSARVTREFAAGMALSRRPSEASATWGESQTSWGTASTEGRPAQAQRNAQGFSVGDRFRYRLTDLAGVRRSQTTYLWRVDRIDPDGSLWVNDGRQRLDPFGQRRSGNEELSGVWLDFAPPLPLAEAMAQGPGVQGAVATTVTERDADGQVTRTDFDGTWRTAVEEVDGPRHFADKLSALLVEIHLLGTSRRGDGVRRLVHWTHRYWFVKELLMPVRITTEESTDGILARRSLHELVAIDLLGPPTAQAR